MTCERASVRVHFAGDVDDIFPGLKGTSPLLEL